MGYHVSFEQTGAIPLQVGVTEKMLQNIFAGSQGDWWVSTTDGVKTLEYRLCLSEGNYSLRGPDYDAMLERLVSEGYNLTAWREVVMSDSENGGMHHHTHLRGTDEQQRSFRLQEISKEIAALEAERLELLSGDKKC